MLRVRRTTAAPSTLRSFFSLLLSSSSFASSPCKRTNLSAPSSVQPPDPAKKIPFTASAHGRSWEDPYHWMRNTGDPDLVDYLRRENGYAEAYMADTCGLRKRLLAEMKGRMPATVATAPEPWGTWLYFQYIPQGKEYPLLCRKPRPPRGFVSAAVNYIYPLEKEQVLLDWNQIAQEYGYVHIGSCRISPNHKFLAYTLDSSGSELFSLHIKDLETNRVIYSSSTDRGVVSLAWTGDSKFLVYTICDQTQRPYQVFIHKLGSGEDDFLIFTELDKRCCVDITSTKDFKYITINSNSRTSSEEGLLPNSITEINVYIIDSSNVGDGMSRVRKRVAGVQYFMEHHQGYFYILTNCPNDVVELADAGGYYLARCRAERSILDNWEVLLVPEEGINYQDMDIFNSYLVIFLHREGIPMFCSIDMPIDSTIQGQKVEEFDPWFFPVPTTLCNITPGSNHDYMSTVYRAIVSSPVLPDLTVDYDMKKREFTILQQDVIKGLCENNEPTGSPLKKLESRNLKTWRDLSEKYICERRKVISHDGVSVLLTILRSSSKDIQDGASAGILHGYGAYGEVLDKGWCSDRLSLLDRGWVVAFADVRGGGGDPSWHQAGTKTNKMNSIHDFAECAKYLIKEGFVDKNRLSAIGVSAGGLLVGATINLHPHLFSAAVLKVPFLDICNTILDPSLPLTILDYDEFGDPKVKPEFEAIQSFSPYDNFSPDACYPSVLVTASFHDSRVGVWEAAKWVAKARNTTCTSCSRSIILKTNMTSGHFGEGGRFLQCEETAFEYAFLMKALGE